MLVEAGSVPEPLCGHYRLHGYPLLQVRSEGARGLPVAGWNGRCHRGVTRQASLVCYRFAMRNSALFLMAGGLLIVGAQTNVAQSIDLAHEQAVD